MADLFRMDGKTALITGAGRGIGKAIAKAFAGQGAELLLTSRNEEKLRLTAQELTAEGAKCLPVPYQLPGLGAAGPGCGKAYDCKGGKGLYALCHLHKCHICPPQPGVLFQHKGCAGVHHEVLRG